MDRFNEVDAGTPAGRNLWVVPSVRLNPRIRTMRTTHCLKREMLPDDNMRGHVIPFAN